MMSDNRSEDIKRMDTPHYPEGYREEITLRDGTPILIRPIRTTDALQLQEGFRLLSAESKYYRFLRVSKELTDKEAQEFATVDYQKRMAIVAIGEYEGIRRIVGVARYSVVNETDGVAETAIVVGDPFQGRGLGTLLMKSLAKYAYEHGVHTFLGTIHTTNQKILSFIKKSGLPSRKTLLEPGIWEIRIPLDEVDDK